MKRIFLTFLIVLPLFSKSQILRDTTLGQVKDRMHNAGIELVKYYHGHTEGFSMEVAGGTLAILANSDNTGKSRPLVYLGVGVGIAGAVINLISTKHLRKASVLFIGNGIVIPLHKKWFSEVIDL
jgi:hypothetical protein